ncbi:hypothetical protein LINPERHAP1_LOCUS20260 [Linum perenne]
MARRACMWEALQSEVHKWDKPRSSSSMQER